jgi:hypothetical protein
VAGRCVGTCRRPAHGAVRPGRDREWQLLQLAHYPWPATSDRWTGAYLEAAVLTDSGFLAGIGGCSNRFLTSTLAGYVPTFSYQFDHRTGPGLTPIPGYVWGAGHAAELAYMWPSFDNGIPIAPDLQRRRAAPGPRHGRLVGQLRPHRRTQHGRWDDMAAAGCLARTESSTALAACWRPIHPNHRRQTLGPAPMRLLGLTVRTAAGRTPQRSAQEQRTIGPPLTRPNTGSDRRHGRPHASEGEQASACLAAGSAFACHAIRTSSRDPPPPHSAPYQSWSESLQDKAL